MTAASLQLVRKKTDAFKAWLTANGAQVLTPTNEWELIRFRDGGITSVVYFRKTGELTFTGSSRIAWDSFQSGFKWRSATPATKRSPGNKKRRSKYVETIRERDGDLCFFCAQPVDEDTESVEHLIALTSGGPDHISNMFLAHRICNQMAGHLSAVEKIARYHRARTTDPDPQAAPLPWEDEPAH